MTPRSTASRLGSGTRRRRWSTGGDRRLPARAPPSTGGGNDRRHERHLAARLADAHLQAVAFEFEFRQVVLANEIQNLLDVVEIHSVRQRSRSRGTSVSTSQPLGGHEHVVLQPHTTDAFDVRAGLNREDHARFDGAPSVRSRPAPCAAPRELPDPRPWPVACEKRLTEVPRASSTARAAASMSDVGTPGRTARDGRGVALHEHASKSAMADAVERSNRGHPRQIDAVSV